MGRDPQNRSNNNKNQGHVNKRLGWFRALWPVDTEKAMGRDGAAAEASPEPLRGPVDFASVVLRARAGRAPREDVEPLPVAI